MRGEQYEHSRWADDRPVDDGAPIRAVRCCRCRGDGPLNVLNLCRRCAPGLIDPPPDPPIDTVWDRERDADLDWPDRWDTLT